MRGPARSTLEEEEILLFCGAMDISSNMAKGRMASSSSDLGILEAGLEEEMLGILEEGLVERGLSDMVELDV